jgi:hypothetical protein
MHHAHYINSEVEGCWFPMKRAGNIIQAGELIGVMKDYFGNVIKEYRLEEDCQLLYQADSYSVPKNSPLLAYGHYDICIMNRKNTGPSDIPLDSHTHAPEELHNTPVDDLDSAGIHAQEFWEDML